MRTASSLVRALGVLTSLLLSSGAAPAPVPTPPAAKLAVPDTAAQKSARTKVNETFGAEIAKAKKAGEKDVVAKELLKTADDSANDASVKYVALTMSRDLAVADGDAETAMSAITGLEAFAIDAVKLKVDTLIAILKSPAGPQDALVGSAIEDATGADRFPLARQLAETALTTAKSAGDASAIANANAWIVEIREVESASGAAKKATGILAAKPGDPSASLTAGRFEAYFKNHWDTGLALLSSANDATLKSLARSDLDGTTDPAKEVEIADGWWVIAGKEKGIAQAHIRQHAGHWYRAALPMLTGLDKARAENRIKESGPVRVSYAGWIDLLRNVNIERDSLRGKYTFERGALSMGEHAKLKLARKPEKSYTLRVEYSRLDSRTSGGTLIIILPVADSECSLSIDPEIMGLEKIDGKGWSSSDTLVHGQFGGVRKKHLVEITVLQDPAEARIAVQVDGKQCLAWKGATSRMNNSGDYNLSPAELGIGTWDQAITVYGIAVREE